MNERALISHRYEPIEILGEGGFGQVWRVRDTLLHKDVALKLFIHDSDLLAAERWREAAMLRNLQLPGVVPLLDEGIHNDVAFIVTELVDGQPFPRTENAELLLERTIALLEILESMHAHGVIHGDIKPDNVYIRSDGQLTFLDFGLSRPTATTRSWDTLSSAGSPLYMAPEQFQGMSGSPAADMYAAGVMLYEALTGVFPHEARTRTQLLRLRLLQDPEPVRKRCPQTPEPLAEIIDVMLQRDPERRLEHTRAWLSRHVHQRPTTIDAPTDILEELLQRCHDGLSTDIIAPPGSGRRTLMRQALDILRHGPTPPLELASGNDPYESLRRALGIVPRETESLEELRHRIREHLIEQLQSGVVVVAWAPMRLDPWSLELLEGVREEGPILMRTSVHRGGHKLSPPRLDAASLGAFFHGPTKGYQVPERIGREIRRRTGGYVPQVQKLLRLWERHHLIRQDQAKYRISLDALEQLESGWDLPQRSIEEARSIISELPTRSMELLGAFALLQRVVDTKTLCMVTGQSCWWVQAYLELLEARGILVSHEDQVTIRPEFVLALELSEPERKAKIDALRRTLPPNDILRTKLPLATLPTDELVEEALTLAHTLDQRGDIPGATGLLKRAWIALEDRDPSPQQVRNICLEWAQIALSTYSVRTIETALLTIQHAAKQSQAPLDDILALLESARLTSRSESKDALEKLQVLGTLRNPILELRRRMYITSLISRLQPEQTTHALDEMERYLETQPENKEARATLLGWRGHYAFRSADYEQAAMLHEQASEQKRRPTAKLSSKISQAYALLNAFKPEEALRVSEQAIQEAQGLRHIDLQFNGWYAYNEASYRVGNIDRPIDEDLIEALKWYGVRSTVAALLLKESAVAWRQHNTSRAIQLAEEAEQHWLITNNFGPGKLARIYIDHLRASITPDSVEEALKIFEPRLKAQALVFIQRQQPLPPQALDELSRCVEGLQGAPGEYYLEMLSIQELRQAIP